MPFGVAGFGEGEYGVGLVVVHCLEIVTATNYPAADARSDLVTYRNNHSEVLETQSHDLSVRNTEIDGSGVDHYHAMLRFSWAEDKQVLRNDAETWLNNNFSWWAWRYHECDHDADDRPGCTWDAQNASSPLPPAAILNYYA